MVKRYFRYLAFLEGCWHTSVYPNYRYKPRKKIPSPKLGSQVINKDLSSVTKKKAVKMKVSKSTPRVLAAESTRFDDSLELVISELTPDDHYLFHSPLSDRGELGYNILRADEYAADATGAPFFMLEGITSGMN